MAKQNREDVIAAAAAAEAHAAAKEAAAEKAAADEAAAAEKAAADEAAAAEKAAAAEAAAAEAEAEAEGVERDNAIVDGGVMPVGVPSLPTTTQRENTRLGVPMGWERLSRATADNLRRGALIIRPPRVPRIPGRVRCRVIP